MGLKTTNQYPSFLHPFTVRWCRHWQRWSKHSEITERGMCQNFLFIAHFIMFSLYFLIFYDINFKHNKANIAFCVQVLIQANKCFIILYLHAFEMLSTKKNKFASNRFVLKID